MENREPLMPDDKPNFYEIVFGRALTPEEVEEDRYNHHFLVKDIDSTLDRAQRYIDEHGGWKIMLPKTPISYGFIAAIAVEPDNPSQIPDIIFIDEDPARADE